MDLDLPVVSTHWPNPAAQTAKFMLLSQNMTSCDFFFSPLPFFQRGGLLLLCLICCSCWHVWGQQHPSYNSFGSWIHCVVTGCSGLALYIFPFPWQSCKQYNVRRQITEAFTQFWGLSFAIQPWPNWHDVLSALHCLWDNFLGTAKRLVIIFLDKCIVLNIRKYFRPQP